MPNTKLSLEDVERANAEVNRRMEAALVGWDPKPPENQMALIAFMLGGAAEAALKMGMSRKLFKQLIRSAEDQFMRSRDARH